MSVSFSDRKRVDRPSPMPESTQSLARSGAVRAGVLVALLSSGCASQATQQVVQVPKPAPSASMSANWPFVNTPAQTDKPAEPEIPPGSMVIMGSAPKSKAWPDVPSNCAYTGVVLEHDSISQPHRIRLENMCLHTRDGINNIYEGKHLWVEADSRGHFPLPFHGVHLEEKSNQLILAFTLDGVPVEEPLVAGSQPDTQSFEHAFVEYFILPVD